jgi:P27 family predicted phage terminase small subunit
MVAMNDLIVPGSDDPVMPDDFDQEHAAKWREVLALLRARGGSIGEYGDVVRIYVLSYVEAKRARAHVAEHGAIVPAPRTGIPTHNPYRKVAQEAELQVARLAEVLGMTPTSRAKISRAASPPVLPGTASEGELGTVQLGQFEGAVDIEDEPAPADADR